MALIVSGKGNTAFRSEEVVCITHLINNKTKRLSSCIGIYFKSGTQIALNGCTIAKAKKFKDKIIEILKQEY